MNGAMRHYRFIDYATQLYIAVVGLLIAFFHNERVPLWPFLLPAHAVGLLAIHVLVLAHARRPRNRLLDLLRHFYPILLYTALYCETGLLNQMFVAGYLDGFFIRLEERLFGFQPCVVFMERVPYLLVSELFYFSYSMYFVMIAGVGLALYLQDRGHFFHYVSLASFVFYICYLTFIFLPVAGPAVYWMEGPEFWAAHGLPPLDLAFPAAIQWGPFFHIMGFIYYHFEGHGAAFPSSHVAVAICTAWFSWRYLPRIRHIHLVVVLLLCLATVYCRYHYAVDVLAGALVAAVLMPLGQHLYRRCGESGV